MIARIVMAAVLLPCLAAAASAQTYTVLHEFGSVPNDGYEATGPLVSDGVKLYGVTLDGGDNDGGTIYSLNLDGSGYAVLHSFEHGDEPVGGLALADGALYGTTCHGGANDDGMVYSIKTDGSGFTPVYSFLSPGDDPDPSPVTVSDGTIYGQLENDPDGGFDDGVVYSVKTDGTGYTVLTGFGNQPGDGELPWGKLLLEGGALYGATKYGGPYYAHLGTLFSLPAAGGAHSILCGFSGDDGLLPVGGLVSDGPRLYGKALSGMDMVGPTARMGSPFILPGSCVFAIDKSGAGYTILRTFDIDATFVLNDGLALDGNRLYGIVNGIAGLDGTPGFFNPGQLFSIDTNGAGYRVLHMFDGLAKGKGAMPSSAPLILDGVAYGATIYGGKEDDGVIYSFSIPSPPITLTPNRSEFFSTDYIAVRANVAAIPGRCIPFIRVTPPSGQPLYCVQGRGFTEVPTPFLGFPGIVTVPAPITDYPVFDTLFRGMPLGEYTLEGGAIDVEKTTDLLNPVYVGPVDSQTLVIR
jgi:uncharacterized repeat protein (TIGR03803 family)